MTQTQAAKSVHRMADMRLRRQRKETERRVHDKGVAGVRRLREATTAGAQVEHAAKEALQEKEETERRMAEEISSRQDGVTDDIGVPGCGHLTGALQRNTVRCLLDYSMLSARMRCCDL